MHLFRSCMSIDDIRAVWNKGYQQPLLRLLNDLGRPYLRVDGRPVSVTAADGRVIACSLYYHLPLSQLRHETRLVLDCPGGGFISMPPAAHSDYLSGWAKGLSMPVLAIDYAKVRAVDSRDTSSPASTSAHIVDHSLSPVIRIPPSAPVPGARVPVPCRSVGLLRGVPPAGGDGGEGGRHE